MLSPDVGRLQMIWSLLIGERNTDSPYRERYRDRGLRTRLHGRVPTDDVSIARLRLRWNQICLQPITLDQVSFDWNGPLQILGRKIHQAHPSLQLRQDVCRLAERVEDVANLTTMEFSLSDGDHLRRVREAAP